MYRSQAEVVVRRALEETGAEFTEEQIQAIALITTKVAAAVIEEAIAQWRPGGNSKPRYYAG